MKGYSWIGGALWPMVYCCRMLISQISVLDWYEPILRTEISVQVQLASCNIGATLLSRDCCSSPWTLIDWLTEAIFRNLILITWISLSMA